MNASKCVNSYCGSLTPGVADSNIPVPHTHTHTHTLNQKEPELPIQTVNSTRAKDVYKGLINFYKTCSNETPVCDC